MLSDTVSYYEQNVSIMPFVSAPISGHQDTLIIAHQDIAKHDKEFLNQLFDTISTKIVKSICIRIFNYNSYIVIAIIFPTSIKEDGSGRSGLVFSIGLMIEKQNVQFLDNSIWLYFNIFISLINRIFEVNMLERGADKIINSFKIEDSGDCLSKDFLLLKNILIEISNIFTFTYSKISWHRKKIKNLFKKNEVPCLPKFIIYNKKMNKIEIILEHLLVDIEKYLKRHTLKDSVTKEIDELLVQSISLVEIDVPYFSINNIEYKNMGDHNMISIY